ncbi:MAG: DUF1016 family protein [Bacilli bacterium]|nr:DUF1016 family protein [Bacilli bacterium]
MNYYNQIKEKLVDNEVYKKVKDYSKNRSDLITYYEVGKLIVEAQGGESRAKYGDNLIKEYSLKLTKEVNKKYGERNLRNMRQFYIMFKNKIWHSKNAKLTWSHYKELLPIKNMIEIEYYIKISIEQNLSYRELHDKIKNKEYERLDNKTKEKLIVKAENEITDFIKNPILLKNSYNYTYISEKILKKLILEDMENFLTELGEGFSFIKSEYKIKLGNRYNYIDLLLYNIKYNCYTVIELKVTELKSEHIGQIEKYINYIDKNVKQIMQNKTIGIIICKRDNEFVMEYCSDSSIFKTTYKMI